MRYVIYEMWLKNMTIDVNIFYACCNYTISRWIKKQILILIFVSIYMNQYPKLQDCINNYRLNWGAAQKKPRFCNKREQSRVNLYTLFLGRVIFVGTHLSLGSRVQLSLDEEELIREGTLSFLSSWWSSWGPSGGSTVLDTACRPSSSPLLPPNVKLTSVFFFFSLLMTMYLWK